MKTLLWNGKVYTGEGRAQAFAMEGGRFVAAGSNEEILALRRDGDRVVDLAGRFACPGFNDSHMHLLGFGAALGMAQLAGHTGSLEEMLACVADFARNHPPRPGQWLRGRGWNQDYFSGEKKMPDRWDLDRISTDYPIALSRACGHVWAVNSKALEAAGIGPDTPDPVGGAVGRKNGKPDGLLYDNAIGLAGQVIPAPGPEDILDMLDMARREVNRRGITSVQTDDYSTFRVPWETVNGAYRALEADGRLTARIYEQANFSEPEELRRFVETGNVTGRGSEYFKIGPLKLLGDGSLGARTAHLSVPYADDPSTRGFSLFTDERLRELVSYAHAHGMQIAVHAIGDECLERVMNALEAAQKEAPREDCRHGIVHCQISRSDQLDRIARMGLHVYAQSIFLDYDNHIVEKRVGKELASTSYSWKTLMGKGVSVSNGSDCPVELPDVLTGIQCAVTRTSLDGTGPYLPHEAFTPEEALDSFTWRGAEASFEEDLKGRIKAGQLADFVILDESPLEARPETIHDIKVLETWMDGKKVYGRD